MKGERPSAYIAIEANVDYEHDTAIAKYVALINEIRGFSNLPQISLYWSLHGPRIKDRFHTYEPLNEHIHMYDYKTRAERYEVESPDEQARSKEKLAEEIRKQAIQSYRKAPVMLKFADDPSPRIMFVNPTSLRRVCSPGEHSNHARSSVNGNANTKSNMTAQDFQDEGGVLGANQSNPAVTTIFHASSKANDCFSLANLKSGILLIRFAKVLNRIRTSQCGLPPLSVYWTAATRNKQLSNQRMGLILFDSVTEKWWYTGSKHDARECTSSESNSTNQQKYLVGGSTTTQQTLSGPAASNDTTTDPQSTEIASTSLQDTERGLLSPFEQLMHAYFQRRSSNLASLAARSDLSSARTELESHIASLFHPLSQVARSRKGTMHSFSVGPPTLQVLGSSDMAVPVEDWRLVVPDLQGESCSDAHRVYVWSWDDVGRV